MGRRSRERLAAPTICRESTCGDQVELATTAVRLIGHPALRLLGLSCIYSVMPNLNEELRLLVDQARYFNIDSSNHDYLLRKLVSGLARSGHISGCEAVAEAAIDDDALRAETLAEAALCVTQQEDASRLAEKVKAFKNNLNNAPGKIEAAIAIVSLRAGSIEAVYNLLDMTNNPHIKKRLLIAIAQSPQIFEQRVQLWLSTNCLELQSKNRYVDAGPPADFVEFAGPALTEIISSLCDVELLDCAAKLATDIQDDRFRVRAPGVVAIHMMRRDPRRARKILALCQMDHGFITGFSSLAHHQIWMGLWRLGTS